MSFSGISHTLFIDCILSPWEQPFVRIKDTKKTGNDWKDVGAVIVDSGKIHELIRVLKGIEKEIKNYE